MTGDDRQREIREGRNLIVALVMGIAIGWSTIDLRIAFSKLWEQLHPEAAFGFLVVCVLMVSCAVICIDTLHEIVKGEHRQFGGAIFGAVGAIFFGWILLGSIWS